MKMGISINAKNIPIATIFQHPTKFPKFAIRNSNTNFISIWKHKQ